MNRYILYHNNCPDGFGAALAAWKKFGDQAQYLGVNHGDPPPEIQAPSEVFILDFAYPRPILLAMAQQHQVQVIDHHKTAQEALAGLDFAHFDLSKSGAVLAWEYFHPEAELPRLFAYIQDQDLWHWALPHSHEICTALGLYPYDFDIWDGLEIDKLRQEGQVALAYKNQLVKSLCEKVEFFEIAGYSVPVVNTPLFSSELGNTLCQNYPEAAFSASYCDFADKRKWSLRSIGAFDVSAIARKFGGGGHPNAAGFSTPSAVEKRIQPNP